MSWRIGIFLLFTSTLAAADANLLSDLPDISAYPSAKAARDGEVAAVKAYRQFRSFPYLDKAKQYLQQGNRLAAKVEIEKALAADPTDLANRLSYAAVLYQLAQYRSVVAQADMLLHQAPGFVPALLYRGLSYSAVGASDRAAEDFASVAHSREATDKDCRMAVAGLVDAAFKMADYGRALEVLNAQADDSFATHYQKARALQNLGRIQEARGEAQQALALTRVASERAQANRILAGSEQPSGRDQASRITSNQQKTFRLNASRVGEISRIEIPVEEPVRLQAGRLGSPERVFLDISAASPLFNRGRLFTQELEDKLVARVRVAETAGGNRVVLDLRQPARIEISRLEAPSRLVVELRGARATRITVAGASGVPKPPAAGVEPSAVKPTADASPLSAAFSNALALEAEGKYNEAARAIQAAPGAEDRADLQAALGWILLKAGRKEEALAAFTAAAQREQSPEQKFLVAKQLGLLLAGTDREEEGRRWLEVALETHPDDPNVLATAARIDMRRKEYVGAVRGFERALAKTGDLAMRRELVQAYIEAGDLDQAAAALRDSLAEKEGAADQKQADWLQALSAVERRRGNVDESLALDRRTLECSDLPRARRGEICERLGYAALKSGDLPGAVASLRNALASGRDTAQVRTDLGHMLFQMNQPAEALKEFSLVAGRADGPALKIAISRCYIRLGQPGVAIYHLESAARAELPSDQAFTVQNELGFLYAAEESHGKAAEAWSKALLLRRDPVIAVCRVRSLRLAGRTDDTGAALEEIDVAGLPAERLAEYWEERGEAALQSGDLEAGMRAFEQANRAHETAAYHYRLGLLCRTAGRYADSATHLQRASKLDPSNAQVAADLGYAYVGLRKYHDAAAAFEAILARAPDYPVLPGELGYLYQRTCQNQLSARWFRTAIDQQSRAGASDAETALVEENLYTWRRQLSTVERSLSFALYQSYRGASGRRVTTSAGSLAGAYPAQGGAEVAYQPPRIGFRNNRIFQVFVRTLWADAGATGFADPAGVQGGLGIRYKPLARQNVLLSVERLFKIGRFSENNWMLRAQYSVDRNLFLPRRKTPMYYASLYGDSVALLAGRSRRAVYAEVRQGVGFKIAQGVVLAPHAAVDGRAGFPNERFSTYLEWGPGMSLQLAAFASPYRTERAIFEILTHYKWLRFHAPGAWMGNAASGSWTVAAQMSF